MINLIHGDCLEVLKTIPDESVDAVVTDPPYFEIKGDFDFIYSSHAEYLKLIESCAIEFKRLLKPNGSLLIFGHAKRIAYIQVIYDKYFNLENSLVWEKRECQTKIGINEFRCFAPITERALYYSLETEKTGLQEIYDNPDCFKSIKEYMDSEKRKSGLSNKQLNAVLETATNGGGLASHFFGFTTDLNKTQFAIPTAEMYAKLQTTGFFSREYEDLRREYEALRLEYEDLRLEYETLRRPFNNIHHLTDVIKHSQESHISKQFEHDTIKPIGLMTKLIETVTRENQVVLDPFMGSGTTGIACRNLNRQFIGIEIDAGYYDIAYQRIHQESQTQASQEQEQDATQEITTIQSPKQRSLF